MGLNGPHPLELSTPVAELALVVAHQVGPVAVAQEAQPDRQILEAAGVGGLAPVRVLEQVDLAW
jgi:hypothetical protein